TLRLAEMLDSTADAGSLAHALADRAQFRDGASLVDGLTARGLLDGGRLTAAGRGVVAGLRAVIAAATSEIWDDLPLEDVEAATSVLNEVVERVRAVLARAGKMSYD